MSERPLVSIITPTLNRAGLLHATLRSVRAQTYPNVEHLVQDGGSTDGTIELLQKLEDTYRLRWASKADAGMYPAINAGLRRAEGTIVAYLNSDDLYFPWTVEVMVRAFERHPEADFLFGDALAIDDETGSQQMILNPPFDLDFIRRVGFLPQPAVFWRRTAFDGLDPFDETLRYVADCDSWMRVGASRRFVKVHEFVAIERNHGGTLRQSIGSPVWAELEDVRRKYVTLAGAAHDRAVRRHRLRSKVWTRLYAGLLLLQTLVPRSLRRGPWSRLLNSRTARPSRSRLFVRAIPWIGRLPWLRGLVDRDLLGDSRHWLEPE